MFGQAASNYNPPHPCLVCGRQRKGREAKIEVEIAFDTAQSAGRKGTLRERDGGGRGVRVRVRGGELAWARAGQKVLFLLSPLCFFFLAGRRRRKGEALAMTARKPGLLGDYGYLVFICSRYKRAHAAGSYGTFLHIDGRGTERDNFKSPPLPLPFGPHVVSG